MKIRIYLIVEPGETKQEFKKEIEDKYGKVIPPIRDCIEAISPKLTEEGKRAEFLVNSDIFFEHLSSQIEKEVAEKVKIQIESQAKPLELKK